jgi:uncharacterized membrane protein YhaH (DUF805 family)
MALRPVPGMRWLLFSVSGRLSRRTYAWALLLWALTLGITVSAAVNAPDDSTALAVSGLGFILVCLTGAWSIAVMSIKRLHDAGLPGMLVIGLVVPAASFLVLLVIMLWRPDKGPNRHGPASDQPGY